jgi:hypothetical protein
MILVENNIGNIIHSQTVLNKFPSSNIQRYSTLHNEITAHNEAVHVDLLTIYSPTVNTHKTCSKNNKLCIFSTPIFM